MIIEYTKQAQTDLENIYLYIAVNLSAPDTAANIYTEITTKIRSLDTLSLRNSLVDEEPWKTVGLRKMFVKNYIVFYTTDDKAVRIIRIMYGGRDIYSRLDKTDINE